MQSGFNIILQKLGLVAERRGDCQWNSNIREEWVRLFPVLILCCNKKCFCGGEREREGRIIFISSQTGVFVALCGINGYVSGTLNVIICSIPLFCADKSQEVVFTYLFPPDDRVCGACVVCLFGVHNEEGMTTQGE